MSVEWLLFLAVLAIGGIPLYRKGPFAIVLLVAGAVMVFVAAQAYTEQQRRVTSLAERAAEVPREGRPGGFVTSDTCQSCHPQQHASWRRSFHRTMTQYATPQSVRGNFEEVTLQLDGVAYRLERRGDEFWVEMPDPDWKLQSSRARPGSLPPQERVWRRIGLLTGSHHMQAYWVPSAKSNLQYNFPFTYLFEDERWVPRNDVFLMDPKYPPYGLQLWNTNCIQCHSTGGQPRPQGDPFVLDTRVGEVGIACEACHGPAEKHVALNQNPLRRYAHRDNAAADNAIVNPARLDHVASSQVCGQCHSIKDTPGHLWRDEGSKYRPGGDLEKYFPVVRPRRHANEPWFRDNLRRNPTFVADRYWPDGLVRVSGREFNGLVESPCYQRGQLGCLSCHSMHDSDPNDQLASRMESNQACLQCHRTLDERAHTHHAAGSGGSLCYNCHMPHTTYGLMKAIRSHTIDSPTVAATLATGRPNACNLCHLDRTLAWSAERLQAWYGQKIPALSADEQAIPAIALLALRGDAGQRALAAWHLGWEPARRASGDSPLPPYLAQLLDDPYSTVRFLAQRSLKRLPGYENFSYDFIGPPSDRAAARQRALTQWRAGPVLVPRARVPALDPGDATWARLLRERDDHSMYLQE